jgi:hypothetical protein
MSPLQPPSPQATAIPQVIILEVGSSLARAKGWRHTAVAVAWGMPGVTSAVAAAQDMMRHVDLTSPERTTAETTRADVEAKILAAKPTPVDLTGKKLSGLDLSGLDLSHGLLRAARLNKTKLAGPKLDGAILDQAWLLEADLSQATLKGASMFAAQIQRARIDGADLSGARIAADLTGASLVGASLIGADLGADMKNQSMGLMHAVLRSTIERCCVTPISLAQTWNSRLFGMRTRPIPRSQALHWAARL